MVDVHSIGLYVELEPTSHIPTPFLLDVPNAKNIYFGELEDPSGMIFTQERPGYNAKSEFLPPMVDDSSWCLSEPVAYFEDMLLHKRHGKWGFLDK